MVSAGLYMISKYPRNCYDLTISSSDLHFWHDGGDGGSLVVTKDYILGHEGAGIIVHTGSNVTSLQKGDRVAIEPGIPCHCLTCYHCSVGSYNLCPDVVFTGVPVHHGSIRRFHVHPAQYLHKLPDKLDYTDGALAEPLSVVMHAFERSPVALGQPALVCGAGPIGLCALAAAKASGAWPLVITDVDPARLKFAKSFIPECEAYKCDINGDPAEMAKDIVAIYQKLGSEAPSNTYECTGIAASVKTAAFSTRTGGEVMVIGVGKREMDGLPFMHLSFGEIDLKFMNRYHHSWPKAIRLLESGYVNLKPIVSHTFKLEDAVEAMETQSDRSKGAVKVHVQDGEL